MTWETQGTILPGGGTPPAVPELPTQLSPQPVARRPRRRLPRPNLTSLIAVVAVVALAVAAFSVYSTTSLRHSVADLKRTVAASAQQQAHLQAQLDAAQAAQKGLQTSLDKTRQNTIDTSISAKVLKSVFTVEAGNAIGSAFAVRRSDLNGAAEQGLGQCRNGCRDPVACRRGP